MQMGNGARGLRWIGEAVFVLVASALVAVFVSFPTSAAAYAASLETGVYEIGLSALQASGDGVSMCDRALVKPAKLTVADSGTSLQLSLKPLSSGGLSGYLGSVKCFPTWQGSGTPPASAAASAQVLSTYASVTDEYNASSSSDAEVRGKKYPKDVSIPWNLQADTHYIQVYVPVMNSISAGSGWQYVRLKLDYASAKKVEASAETSQGESGEDKTDQGDEAANADGSSKQASSSAAAPSSTASSSAATSTRSTKSLSSSKRASSSSSSSSPSSSSSQSLKFAKLSDGAYTVSATMVKTDKKTLSMADKAISHDVALNVEGGAYTLDLSLSSITVGSQMGYLGKLSYFKTGYTIASGGAPAGKTAPCKVLSVQMSGGKKVSDRYGTDYPAKVRIPLIKEAKVSGYVPLSAFVPIMDAIAAGTGNQAMYLKIDRASVERVSGDSAGEPSSSDAGATTSASSSSASFASSSSHGSTTATSSGSGRSSMLGANTLPTNAGASRSNSPSDLGGAVSSHAQAADAETGHAANATQAVHDGQAPVKVSEVHVDAPQAQAENSAKEPPLKGAAVPVAITVVAVIALGAAISAFRHRSWMDDEL